MKVESAVTVLLLTAVTADIYLHNPRGANNRLNERTATRTNNNRLHDSQNNNRGGYNVGDATDQPSTNENEQYYMKYFQSGQESLRAADAGSYLTVEWTNQHGCGRNEEAHPHKLNCQLVLQYMCQPYSNTLNPDTIRNGQNTNTPQYTAPAAGESAPQRTKRRGKDRDEEAQRGQHETWDWYESCYTRERNKGLFTADQKLHKSKLGVSSAIHTRQNPDGGRSGYECPEERDYYPYFHGTPWKDIAVLTENKALCRYFRSESFNVKSKYECLELVSGLRIASRWNNFEECEKNGGQWTELFQYLEIVQGRQAASCESASRDGVRYRWAVPHDTRDGKAVCMVQLEAPQCYEAPWSRSNHLGNGRTGVPSNYTWKLPHFPSGTEQRCVLRLRYNISTDDYDPYNTDSSYNEDTVNGRTSPVQQNPYVNVGSSVPLRLAINTAQFGRTFQDRSHVFVLRPRTQSMSSSRVFNLNVRGKRGNIVQVYPAVEYDFIPNRLPLTQDDLVHIQWTGSNTHNNNAPGGDGQTGDAGEGTKGTDRNNIVQTLDPNLNFPLPFEQSTMWNNSEVVWTYFKSIHNPEDVAVNMASSGYYRCLKSKVCSGESAQTKSSLNELLNNAAASYEGVVLRFKKGTYHYMCTRNNNFTNRSQKGTIIVE